MKQLRFAIGSAAGLLVVAACCPSLWLTVTKGDVEARPAVPVPVIADPPILPPPWVQNRLDVFAKGQRTTATVDFMDAFDPANDLVSAETRGMAARDAIAVEIAKLSPGTDGDVAVDPTEMKQQCVDAKVDRCDGNGCFTLLFASGLPLKRPRIVRITSSSPNETRIIEECDSYTWKPSADDPLNPCGPPQDKKMVHVRLSMPISERENAPVHVCMSETLQLARPLFTFVHASDIQLRDGAVKLGDPDLSKRLDWIMQSAEYDNDLQFYNQYVAEAILATVDKEVKADANNGMLAPSFMIHTGDGIDAGVMGELARFHELIDRMSIPVFDVLGNHDLLIFGNLLPAASRDSDGQCASTGSVLGTYHRYLPGKLCVDQRVRCDHCTSNEAELVAKPTHAATRDTFIGGLQHASYDGVPQLETATGTNNQEYCAIDPVPGVGRDPGLPATKIFSEPHTRMHGFDLNKFDSTSSMTGYYAFAQTFNYMDEKGHTQPRHALYIVLNGEDLNENQGGVYGRVGPVQLAWLRKVVACIKTPEHAHDLVFVFAHQPLSTLDSDEGPHAVEAAIDAAGKNVVAFMYGHNHEHAICGDYIPTGARARTTTCQHYWEVETASLIEYPQELRLVRVKQIGSKLAYLELTTFGERLADSNGVFATLVSRARRGAERDFCRTHDGAICTSDLRPYRTDGRDTHGRLFFALP